jgi:energy-coupling factor transporter ATP-binding protein EcfA2
VAVTGPNGAGKSTLIKLMVSDMKLASPAFPCLIALPCLALPWLAVLLCAFPYLALPCLRWETSTPTPGTCGSTTTSSRPTSPSTPSRTWRRSRPSPSCSTSSSASGAATITRAARTPLPSQHHTTQGKHHIASQQHPAAAHMMFCQVQARGGRQ